MGETRWRRLSTALLLGLVTAAAGAETPAVETTQGATTPARALAAALLAEPPLLQPVGPQAGFGDLLVLGTGARFELAAAPGSHVPVLDGSEVTVAQLAGPWQPGRHAVSLQAVPPPPEGAPVQAPLQFVYDPGPPKIQWEVGNTSLLDVYGLDQDVDRERPPRHTIPEPDKRIKLLWSPDGRRWLPLLPKDAQTDASGALADWITAADKPQVFLWALGNQVFDHGVPVSPRKLELVRVWAGDELSAVRDLRLRVLPSPSGGHLLEILAADLVGNLTSVTWPLAR
jgi:hypothetical protein